MTLAFIFFSNSRKIQTLLWKGGIKKKMKVDKVNVVKIAGWVTAAVAGFMVSWASDKQAKKQNDENFKKYIEEKENGES